MDKIDHYLGRLASRLSWVDFCAKLNLKSNCGATTGVAIEPAVYQKCSGITANRSARNGHAPRNFHWVSSSWIFDRD
jgi:hypothetical protein